MISEERTRRKLQGYYTDSKKAIVHIDTELDVSDLDYRIFEFFGQSGSASYPIDIFARLVGRSRAWVYYRRKKLYERIEKQERE